MEPVKVRGVAGSGDGVGMVVGAVSVGDEVGLSGGDIGGVDGRGGIGV